MKSLLKIMKYCLMILIIFIFQSRLFGDTKILEIIEGRVKINPQDIKTNDPLYPALILSDLLLKTKSEKPDTMIEKLEALLHKNDFSSDVNGKLPFQKDRFIVGIEDSFRLWRELLYLCLGRAYYENNEADKAILYLNAVPSDSPFVVLAKLELGWAYLRNKEEKNVKALINDFRSKYSKSLNENMKHELELLNAYYLVSIKEYDKAIQSGESFTLIHDEEQSHLQKKVLAEAWFGKYLTELNNLDFTAKVKMLTKITGLSKSVSPRFYDPEFAFLAGEADWHLASVFRVKDPVKYKEIWEKYLSRAQNWIKPFVEKSIHDNHAIISEEAMFFAIALLWEMENYKDAEVFLVALPTLFPQGEYLEDVYQMLGDFHYDEKRFDKAIDYYDKLTRHGSEDKTAYGVYKAAWSFYNLDDKWTALRHLERLYIHYNKEDDKKIEDKKGLFREVREDLLSVMAELMEWDKALEEVEIFKENAKNKLAFKANLAESYNHIGKYDFAVSVWLELLKNNYAHDQSPIWLSAIGKAYLAASKKQKIAEAFNQYLKIVLDAHAGKKTTADLDEEISKIILTVHKEAKKSDNYEDWQAVDQLYGIYERDLPDSQNAKVWYFGAQRYENIQNLWEAVQWYKKAAMIKNYENYLDAAHSVLRIVNSINDRLSLSDIPLKERIIEYQKISNVTKWYIDEFPKEESRKLAEFIYVEALYYHNKAEVAEDYIVKRFENQNEDIDSSWNLFLAHNKRLYQHKEWILANQLSDRTFQNKNRLKEEWNNNLAKIYQESAFQAAFDFEKKEKSDIDEISKWYHKAGFRKHSGFFDINLSLKSWNNLFSYALLKSNFNHFEKELITFKEVQEIQNEETYDNKNLLFNIHNMAAKVHTKTGRFHEKAKDYFRAARFSSDKDESASLIWDALVLFGSYYDDKNFKIGIEQLNNQMPSYLKSQDRQVVLGRLYYYLKDYKNAWDILKPLLKDNMDSKTALLFVDLFTNSKNGHSNIYNEMNEYRKQSKETWVKIPYFNHLWAFDYHDEYNQRISSWIKNENRRPASKDSTLKELAENVKNELTTMYNKKTEMEQSILPFAPQISVRIFCTAPTLTANTIEGLSLVGKHKLEDPQWPSFVTKLEQKITDLKAEKEKEQQICDQQKDKFFHYPMEFRSELPCQNKICFKTKASTEEILKQEQIEISSELSQKIEAYLKMGAHSRAEYVVSELKDAKSISFYMGLIRLAQGDTANSAAVFKTLLDDDNYKDKSKFYLDYIASINDYK